MNYLQCTQVIDKHFDSLLYSAQMLQKENFRGYRGRMVDTSKSTSKSMHGIQIIHKRVVLYKQLNDKGKLEYIQKFITYVGAWQPSVKKSPMKNSTYNTSSVFTTV